MCPCTSISTLFPYTTLFRSFNSDGTFTHITDNTNDDPTYNPEGTVFGRENLINELGGIGGGTQQEADILNYPLNDYTENWGRSEEHTSELQSRENLVCRLLL